MKKISPFLAFLFCLQSLLFANSLPPGERRPLKEHLSEVNKEWLRQPDLNEPAFFANDDERIQTHLHLVEQILRSRETPDLTTSQKANRLLRLDELHQYWQAGKFPRNTFHAVRQPYFVDIQGIPCAVGYLLLRTGEQALVRRISKNDNYAYVRELKKYPELPAWAQANGFALEELAWIQPGYPPQAEELYPVGNGGGTNGRVNAMAVDYWNVSSVVMAGNFTEIDGAPANSIAAWDGEDWHTYGDGLQGEVFAVLPTYYGLFATGNFTLPGASEQVNIARWKDGQWTALQSGDMEGSVFTLQLLADGSAKKLFVGGDFKKINGANMPYLAWWDMETGTWSDAGLDNGEEIPGAFSVDAPVRCMELVDYRYLLIGGDFELAAQNANHPSVSPMPTHHLAYWDTWEMQWKLPFFGEQAPVHAVKKWQGYLLTAGNFSSPNGFAVLDAGLWDYWGGFTPVGDSLAHGFLEHNGELYFFGGFHYATVVSTIRTGVMDMFNFQAPGGKGFLTDGTVRSAASFKGNAYFAGDFTMVNGEPFNGMFYSPMTGLSPIEDPGSQTLAQVFQANGSLHIQIADLPSEAIFTLLSLQGQQVESVKLAAGAIDLEHSIQNFPAGLYLWELRGEGFCQSGKIVK